MLTELVFKSIEKQAQPGVSFEPGLGLRARLRHHACESCVAVCPRQALTPASGGITFAEERCSSCLACLSACPGNAFAGGFDLQSLLSVPVLGEGVEPAVLGCGKAPAQPNLTRLPCLGLLTEPMLAGLHCVARKEILLDVRCCAGCENEKVVGLLKDGILKITGRMATAEVMRVRMAGQDDFGRITTDNSRRFFLRLTKSSLLGLGRRTTALLAMTDDVTPMRTSGEKETSPVNRFLHQAAALLADEAGPESKLLQTYYYELTASEKCDLCPACTGMCPTGALKRNQNDGVKRLDFTGMLCSGCGLCVDFCKKQALTLTSGAGNNPALASTIAGGG